MLKILCSITWHQLPQKWTGPLNSFTCLGDVFHDGSGGYDSFSNFRRGSEARGAPLVEYPPTLPRSERSGPPIPPHHGSDSFYRPISKSRSYADWDEGRGPFGNSVKRFVQDSPFQHNTKHFQI
jgi:hypothetical protein